MLVVKILYRFCVLVVVWKLVMVRCGDVFCGIVVMLEFSLGRFFEILWIVLGE